MPKKILHLLDHSIPLQSGYTFRTRAILRQQQSMGYDIKAITSNRQGKVDSMSETIDGIEFYRIDRPPEWIQRIPIIKQLVTIVTLKKKMKQLIRDWQPDIIHAHSPVLTALAALSLSKRHHIPLVYEIRAFWEDAAVDHGTHQPQSARYKITRALETRVCQQVNAITTICEGLKQDLISRGIASSKITVIPNAVDLSQFSTVSLTSTAELDGLKQKYDLANDFIIGFIGSLYAYEGIDFVIRAFDNIKKKIPNAKYLIVGGGPQFEAWQQLAAESKHKRDIIFTGRVPHHQVSLFYQLIEVLIYPRAKMRLTDLVTPLKPLEAMAMGKCVLASDVGGHRELIQHNQNGILFHVGNEQDFIEKLLMVFDSTQRQTLISQAQTYVKEVRNWPVSVARYQSVYQSCQR